MGFLRKIFDFNFSFESDEQVKCLGFHLCLLGIESSIRFLHKCVLHDARFYIIYEICGIKFTFLVGRLMKNLWKETFLKYAKKNNIKKKAKNLKEGMDKISCAFIDTYVEQLSYMGYYTRRTYWTKKDEETKEEEKKFLETFEQPFPELVTINPYFYSNMYGLKDLPEEILKEINGKTIIDGGGFLGDTPVVFASLFPESKVFAFEPIKKFIDNMGLIVEKGKFEQRIFPINKALGCECKTETFKYGEGTKSEVEVITLDEYFKNSNETIGLIKLDTEGFETKIVEGAKEILKTQKPVLAIAMYHTPLDFFELKDKIKAMNPEYKFMVRRSEMIIPMADLVLIAY